MITPRFSLDQDETYLFITIFAPYTNVKDTEIHVFEKDFRFFSKPYYLRLNLPGKVQETDNSYAKYACDESKFHIRLDKVTPGEHFENLDMITSLLTGRTTKKFSKPVIEVCPTTSADQDEAESEDMESDEEVDEEEWSIDQAMEQEVSPETLLSQHKYGFANNHSGLQDKYEVELGEVADIKNPDAVSPSERRLQRETKEQNQFSDDHYLADLMNNDELDDLLAFQFDVESLTHLSDKNLDQLKELPNKEFLLDKLQKKRLYFGLIDILYAYCYDWRLTQGSHCVESPWNISRISSTLSWFDVFDSMKEVVVACVRRSLCYPLQRNWALSLKVLEDVLAVLNAGRVGILICFLDIQRMFNMKDPYYIQNQLYINDYCVWIQKTSENNLSSLIESFKKVTAELTKDDVGLYLSELEIAASLSVEEDQMCEDVNSALEGVHI